MIAEMTEDEQLFHLFGVFATEEEYKNAIRSPIDLLQDPAFSDELRRDFYNDGRLGGRTGVMGDPCGHGEAKNLYLQRADWPACS
jgi:hypothetical protein